MEQRHIPPAGENMIQHHRASADCPCNPRRVSRQAAAVRGRNGSHQGYKTVRIDWFHNPTIAPQEDTDA